MVQVGEYSLAMRDGRSDGATFDVRAAQWTPEKGWQDVHVFGAGAELPLASVAVDHPDWFVKELTPASGRR